MVYERTLVVLLIEAARCIPGLLVSSTTAGSNRWRADIIAAYLGAPFLIEAKSHSGVSMGNASFQYCLQKRMFRQSAGTSLRDSDLELLKLALLDARDAIDEYLEAAIRSHPQVCHRKISGFPIKLAKAAREDLYNRGLQTLVNRCVQSNPHYIANHYNNRGVYYINIGGSGLFFMGKNPLNLPIPELNGQVLLRLRVGYSGGGKSPPVFRETNPPTEARHGLLRVSGWLNAHNNSPFCLDKVEDIKAMFALKRAYDCVPKIIAEAKEKDQDKEQL